MKIGISCDLETTGQELGLHSLLVSGVLPKPSRVAINNTNKQKPEGNVDSCWEAGKRKAKQTKGH